MKLLSLTIRTYSCVISQQQNYNCKHKLITCLPCRIALVIVMEEISLPYLQSTCLFSHLRILKLISQSLIFPSGSPRASGSQTSSPGISRELSGNGNLRPSSRPIESEFVGVGASDLCFNKVGRWFWNILKLENHNFNPKSIPLSLLQDGPYISQSCRVPQGS